MSQTLTITAHSVIKKEYQSEYLCRLLPGFAGLFSLSPPPVDPLYYLQHQLCHLEPLLQALVGGHWFVVEQAQEVVSLQGLLVVALGDVQHPVLPVKIGELETFLSAAG